MFVERLLQVPDMSGFKHQFFGCDLFLVLDKTRESAQEQLMSDTSGSCHNYRANDVPLVKLQNPQN